MTAYQEEFQRSLADPSGYWLAVAGDVHWYKTPQQGIDASRSPYNTWFADGEINACHNALDELKGQLPVGLVILNDGCTKSHEEITAELVQQVRREIGPAAAFKLVAGVDKLPKTRSGKNLRGTLRSIADSNDWNMPATIEDSSVLEDITQILRSPGLAEDRS